MWADQMNSTMTLEQALKWYRSPEYAPLITLRQKASRGRLVLAEGV